MQSYLQMGSGAGEGSRSTMGTRASGSRFSKFNDDLASTSRGGEIGVGAADVMRTVQANTKVRMILENIVYVSGVDKL